jgi:hypothetical protein
MRRWNPSLKNDSYSIMSAIAEQESFEPESILSCVHSVCGISRLRPASVGYPGFYVQSAFILCRCMGIRVAHFLAFHASSGTLSKKASQYPLRRNSTVKKACTAASGMMYVFNLLQRSIGLM